MQMARANLDFLRAYAGADARHQLRQRVSHRRCSQQRNRERRRKKGYELELALPIFDFGDAVRTGAQARYMAALNRTAKLAVDASSQVRETYSGYRTAYDLARHYRDEIVPLRKLIADENLLRYNGMLIGVFELLADAREQIGSVVQAIEAQRDFWLADAALQGALIGIPMSGTSMNPMSSESTPIGWRCCAGALIGQTMTSRRRIFSRRCAAITAAAAAASVSKVALAALPEPVIANQARHDAAAGAFDRPPIQPGRHAKRLDIAMAHERRRQGIPSGRRAGGARDGARNESALMGLQRPVAGADDRSRRRRPRAHLRHQQATRAHQYSLARPAPAERHGRRNRPDAEGDSFRARPTSMNSSRAAPAPLCITRTPTRWCRWRWA